ncbi:hypothetical protein GBA65_09255 [Rubrobacter marinus]|uniref:Uncharacterized protein n=1 Tax=Rubrobacter marinus TaxID=2653852 RepID=A0A6G8PWW2_9ACTN|nr:hypothetical protein [Rubrobacter marinus]QIN78675.1 hypothetical protein GBA65_09255 [Rubrobacter marinus]
MKLDVWLMRGVGWGAHEAVVVDEIRMTAKKLDAETIVEGFVWDVRPSERPGRLFAVGVVR